MAEEQDQSRIGETGVSRKSLMEGISRRKLLAYAAGAAGAAVMAGSLPAIGAAYGQRTSDVTGAVYGYDGQLTGCRTICATTIGELRQLTASDPGALYYVTASGQEGHFYCDSTDSTSTDNTGTILVSASGIRFKRMYAAGIIHAKWFGAKGDGTADDTAAIQAALDSLPQGGTVFFAQGTYRTTSRLIVRYPNAVLLGVGKRNIQSPIASFAADNVPSTIYADHTGDCLWLSHTNPINGFRAAGLTFVTGGTNKAIRCFGFDLGGSGAFRRDFLFESISVQGFGTVFELYASSASTGSSSSMGVIRVLHCSTMHNNWIAKTAFGQWNGFVYEFNEGGQNGYAVPGEGGIHISGHNISICHNILEGQRDPVKISNNYRGLTIKNNYFEANVGNACIYVSTANGPFDIGENFFFAVQTTHKVHLFATAPGQCSDPYWPQQTNKMEFRSGMTMAERLLNTNAATSYSRSDAMRSEFVDKPKVQTVSVLASGNYASRTPLYETALLSRRGTTSGTGILTDLRSIRVDSGSWVAVCWALRHNNAPRAPYLNIRLNDNGTTAQQIADINVFRHHEAFRQGEWSIVTSAVKANQAANNVMLYYYPYGISPPAGLEYEYFAPVVYTIEDINDIRPYFPLQSYKAQAQSPTFGSWTVGERILNASPAAGSFVGWVCTAAGKAHMASTGTITAGSNQITGVTNIATWSAGDAIKGQGIPAAAKITAVDASGAALTIDANATAAATIALHDAVFLGYGEIAAN